MAVYSFLKKGEPMLFHFSVFVERLGIILRATAVVTFFILAILLSSSAAHPAEVTLAWNATSEPNVGGYKLYCGQASRQYDFYIDVGNTLAGTLTDLQDEGTYYVAVTAYDASGDESDFSNEVAVNLLSQNPVENNVLPPIPKTVLAINCGGPQYIDAEGNVYQPDTLYVGGNTYRTWAPIEGTEDDLLYQSERFGNFSYRIPLPNGSYSVTLKFAELYSGWAGARNFDVQVQGNKVLRNVDLIVLSGKKNLAYDVTLPANVTNGLLTIDFLNNWGNAKVNAILIKEN
jgi:hypothetical protein